MYKKILTYCGFKTLPLFSFSPYLSPDEGLSGLLKMFPVVLYSSGVAEEMPSGCSVCTSVSFLVSSLADSCVEVNIVLG